MEAALKEVFNVHRNVVRDLRIRLQKAVKEKDSLRKSLEQRCSELQEEVRKLKEENRCLATAHSSTVSPGGDRVAVVGLCGSSVESISQGNDVTGSARGHRNSSEGRTLCPGNGQVLSVPNASNETEFCDEQDSVVTGHPRNIGCPSVQPRASDQDGVVTGHPRNIGCPSVQPRASDQDVSSQSPGEGGAYCHIQTHDQDGELYDGSRVPAGAQSLPATAVEEKKTEISPKLQLSRGNVKRKRYKEDLVDKKQEKKPRACSDSLSRAEGALLAVSQVTRNRSLDTGTDVDVANEVLSTSDGKTMSVRCDVAETIGRKGQTSMDLFRVPTQPISAKTASKPSTRCVTRDLNVPDVYIPDLYVPETCQPASPVSKQRHSSIRGDTSDQPDDACEVHLIPETLVLNCSVAATDIADDDDVDVVAEADVSGNHSMCQSSSLTSVCDGRDDSCRPRKPLQLTPYPSDDLSLPSDNDCVDKTGLQPTPTYRNMCEQQVGNVSKETCEKKPGLCAGIDPHEPPQLQGLMRIYTSHGRETQSVPHCTQSRQWPGMRSDSVVFDSTLPALSPHLRPLSVNIPCSGTSIVCQEESDRRPDSPVFTGHRVDRTSGEEVSPALFEEAYQDHIHSPGAAQCTGISRTSAPQRVRPDTPESPSLLRSAVPHAQRLPRTPVIGQDTEEIELLVRRAHCGRPSLAAGQQPCSQDPDRNRMNGRNKTHSMDRNAEKEAVLMQPVQRRNLFRKCHTSPVVSATAVAADEPLDTKLQKIEDVLPAGSLASSRAAPEPSVAQAAAAKSPVARPSQLNASLDPGVHLTQYLQDTPEDAVCTASGSPPGSPLAEEGLDVTLDPRFLLIHQMSAQDTTLISQHSSGIASGSSTGTVHQTASSIKPQDQQRTADLDDSFDRAPVKKDHRKYAFTEVVRKQADRRKLQGFSCRECLEYYRSIGLTDDEVQAKMTHCSRHRAHYVPPSTPEHFWSIGFPDTQECAERGYQN